MNFYGNGSTVNVLKKIVKNNKISHSYLFYGDQGVGKRTIANFFAKTIFCGKENAPCGICENCVKFETKNHPDFDVVGEKDCFGQSFDVENVRDLIRKCFVKPTESDFKIFILNNVDSLLLSASNALLKILEEPPNNVVFILLAKNKDKVLKTIQSRCVSFFVAPITVSECYEILREEYLEEKSSTLKEIASLSLGSIGLAKFYLTEEGKFVLTESLKLVKAYLKKDELLFNSILQTKKYVDLVFSVFKCFLARIMFIIEQKGKLGCDVVFRMLKDEELFEEAFREMKLCSSKDLALAKLCCHIFS